MSWEKYAYTSAGAAMLSESISGGALTITRAVSGTGTVDTDLSEETAVSGDTYELKLLGIDTVEYEGEKARKVSIWTGGADKPYFMHQIGVFGRLNDDPEDTLLFLMQDDRGIEIPAIGTADHEFQIAVLLAVSTKANISLTVDPQVEAIMRMVREMVLKEISQHNDAPDAHAKIITEAVSTALKTLEESGKVVNEERVKEIISGQIGGKGSAIIKDITIPADGWDWQRESDDEEMLGMDDFRWVVDVAVDDVTEDMFPSVALHKAALEVAKRAGLCPTVQANAGVLRFWARNAPEADMAATVALVSPGGASGGGSSSYVLPVATATRLGGVKIGSGVSVSADGTISASTSGITQDEVVSAADTDKMLDEIFPAES